MSKGQVIGMELEVVVSDPRDFGTIHGTGPFFSKVLQVHGEENVPGKGSILLRLKTPLEYEGVSCEFFVASPRLENENLRSLIEGKEVFCNLTRIPSERAASSNPFDLSWWRGGVGLIAALRRA